MIRLGRAVVLGGLPPCDAEIHCPCRAREKGADERGLADARLAGDQHDLPFARAGCSERLVELCELALATDQDALLGLETERQVAEGARGMGCPRLRDEAVAAPVQRLDVARTPGVVP